MRCVIKLRQQLNARDPLLRVVLIHKWNCALVVLWPARWLWLWCGRERIQMATRYLNHIGPASPPVRRNQWCRNSKSVTKFPLHILRLLRSLYHGYELTLLRTVALWIDAVMNYRGYESSWFWVVVVMNWRGYELSFPFCYELSWLWIVIAPYC